MYLKIVTERVDAEKAERLNSTALAFHDPKTASRQIKEWLA